MLDAGGRRCFLSGDKCFLLQQAKLLARAGKLDRQVHARTDRAFYQVSTQHVGYGRRKPGQTPPCRFDAVSVAIPADNVFNPAGCGTGVPFPSGVYSPSVADGYYVVLENLKPRRSRMTSISMPKPNRMSLGRLSRTSLII
jgi:hypothetical protein